jgi:apolipoprotein D and lipocalin family protein
MNSRYLLIAAMSIVTLLAGCSSQRPDMPTVEYVDLDRFVGDWYVIANIPMFLEKDAFNAVENYALNDDGSIATTFTFNKGAFDGKLKEYTLTGFVTDTETNATWGMQFVWPIKADYRIVYLADDYGRTIIAREKRDFVWIMARTPIIDDADYQEMLAIVESLGYDMEQIRKSPQQAIEVAP